MLFDPFEKQFDLPTATIKIGDALRRQVEMVGQKDQCLALDIFYLDAPDRRWEMLLRIKAGQRAELVADDARRSICWPGVSPSEAQICLGSRHKETACLVQTMQSGEVEIAAIHDVERPSLGNDLVENVHIVQLAVADVDEAGMLPRRSSSVCSLMAALAERNGAHGNTDRHKSIVVASSA